MSETTQRAQNGGAVYDLSARAISLAREIDRLGSGAWTLIVIKPDLSSLSWHVEINRVETVRTMELPKAVYKSVTEG